MVQCCDRAAAAGVRPGLTVAHARALLPEGALVRIHQPERELAALRCLSRWALRFSPVVAVDAPDGLLIDIAGCERLFGGAGRLVDRMAEAAGALGFRARVAAAPSFACARAAARFGTSERTVVRREDLRTVLAAMPVAAIGLPEAVVEGLGQVGIERIGHLLDLPRPALAARYGRGLLLRLDQAMARAPETIDPVRPSAPLLTERIFDGPVSRLEAIELSVRSMMEELTDLLAQRECGARQIVLRVGRADAEPLTLSINLSRPSRDAKHLHALLLPGVESMNLGFGVERLALSAPRLGRMPHRDGAWAWAEDGAAAGLAPMNRAFGELLDSLGNRLGADRVVRLEPADSHLPEKKGSGSLFRGREASAPARASSREKSSRSLSSDRPSLLLERPEPITVIAMTPEGPPSWFRWRGMEERIVTSAGPERIAGEWWEGEAGTGTQRRRSAGKRAESYARAYERFILGGATALPPSPAGRRRLRYGSGTAVSCRTAGPASPGKQWHPVPTRDYFKVQDESGRWLWIYRLLESGRWFIHGLWA